MNRVSSTILLAVAGIASLPPADAQGSATRSFAASGFDRIDLGGCDNAAVVLGERFAVVAHGASEDLDRLRIDAGGSTLRIRRVEGGCNGRQRPTRVTVTLPALSAVAISGAGSIDLPAVSTARFDARISGAGSLRVPALTVQQARFHVSGAGHVTLESVRADRLDLDLSGVGTIRAGGSATSLAVDSSGAGEVDTRGLSAGQVTTKASGTGSVHARATGAATIQASGMATVRIEGRPRCSVRKSGLAQVTCG